jgi:hypothetical protein
MSPEVVLKYPFRALLILSPALPLTFDTRVCGAALNSKPIVQASSILLHCYSAASGVRVIGSEYVYKTKYESHSLVASVGLHLKIEH